MNYKFLSKEYYPIKHYKKQNEDSQEFDIVPEENRCSQFGKTGILCDKCFNMALIEKIEGLSSLERLDFINYHLGLYEDPVDYLTRTLAFLNDNEDNFDSSNNAIVRHLQQITKAGISQFKGEQNEEKPKESNLMDFISKSRIIELSKIESKQYDLSRLIRLSEEINSGYSNKNYISVIMLTRALIDHIPPVFGQANFVNVYGQYGSKSFKASMKHLDNSMRKIADSYLHTPIRKKESLPTTTQVNFSQDIDVLLSEIVRKIGE